MILRIIFLLNSIFLFSQTGNDIALMIDNRKVPKILSNTINMTLTNSKGKIRTNKMISKSIDKNRKQIIWFLEPKDEKGVAFLKIEQKGKDDQMRMWLPAFKKVRRISGKKKGDSFMGSDLSYEDLSTRDIENHTYKRLEDEFFSNSDCYVLETTSRKELKSSYSKHRSWINKSNLTVIKEESYDKRGEIKKKKFFTYQMFNDYRIATKILVEDIKKKHTTEVIFSNVSVDESIKETLFHERNLRKIPKN
jgi:hypothetical protein